MASGLYVTGLSEILDGTIDLDDDTLKLMLVSDVYVYDPDHDVIDNSGDDATDPSFCELDATGYTGGYEGAGRKTVTVSVTANKTDDRVEIEIDEQTWESIGGASNDTIGGAILVKEGANDGDSRLIAFFDVTDTPTNGGDVTLTPSEDGNIRIGVGSEE